MTFKILSNILWTLAFLCFLLVLQTENIQQQKTPKQSSEKKQKAELASEMQRYPDFFQAFNSAIEETDESKKLDAITRALDIAERTGFNSPQPLTQLYLMAADIHQNRWHIHFALQNLLAAQTLLFDRDIDNRIKQLRSHIAKMNKERHLKKDYVATRDSGPAKSFNGKVLVAYVYIDDGLKTRWNNKSRLRTEQVLAQVQSWHQSQSINYQIENLEFINKSFIVSRDPNLKQFDKLSFQSSPRKIDRYVELLAQNLGYDNLESFIDSQMQLVNADQGVIIFHSNFEQRSFAKRCGITHTKMTMENGKFQKRNFSNCQNEYVMLTEKIQHNRWDKLHYVQAHEILHVFGADDLYNIQSAAEYAITDIMNFQSRYLSDSNIQPITAYAIGWQNSPPTTPFTILER